MNQETLAVTEESEHNDPAQEQAVREYLLNHSNFFDENPDLLASISLPHESGRAVSLVERQVTVLRERNMEMRHRLHNMLETARENDRLFERTKRLVLGLLEAEDLDELVKILNTSLDTDFDIEFFSILLIGEQADRRRQIVTMDDAQREVGSILRSNRPLCGILRDTELRFLFDDQAEQVGSVAAIPISRGKTIGILALGNNDPHFYRSSMGTLFLSYIADILARMIPKLTD